MTFLGLDLHKRYITACALDEAGVLVAEVRQLATLARTVLDSGSSLRNFSFLLNLTDSESNSCN